MNKNVTKQRTEQLNLKKKFFKELTDAFNKTMMQELYLFAFKKFTFKKSLLKTSALELWNKYKI